MKKMVRIALVSVLAASMSGVPAFAGELRDSIAAAATTAAAASQETPMVSTRNKPVVVAGSALFVGGMAYGLYGFINNENGANSEFGEAESTDVKAGTIGLSLAFAGGLMMFMGSRARQMPSLTFGKKSVGLSKQISW